MTFRESIPFKDISIEDIQLLESKSRLRKFTKGQVIVSPGEIERELYFVASGIQMSYFETERKQQVLAFTYAPGICAIPGSFSFQLPSEYFVSALSDSEMYGIQHKDLETVFQNSRRIETEFRKMTEAILSGVIQRHIELHTLSIEERFRQFCKRSPHLLNVVSHKHIASYLGIDPSNFSKLYNSVRI